MSETVPVWSDLMGGAIKTCYLSQSDSAIAEVGTIVVFNFTGYTIDNEGGISASPELVKRSDIPFESCENQRVQIGESDVIPGLELPLRQSRVNDHFLVRCNSRFAYASRGRPEIVSDTNKPDNTSTKAIPPDTDLEFEITILAFQDINNIGMPDPKPEDDPTLITKINVYQDIALRKEMGNRWFHYQDYLNAAGTYSKGAKKGDDYFGSLGPDEADIVNNTRDKDIWTAYLSCLNNLSACHISNQEYLKAKEVCIKVLTMDPNNIKALLRAARASLGLSSFEESQKCLETVLQIEPDNKLALQEKNKLLKAQRDYKQQQKEMGRNIAKKIAKDNAADKKGDSKKKESKKPTTTIDDDKDDKTTVNKSSTTNEKESKEKDAKTEVAPKKKETFESSNLIMLLATAVVTLVAAIIIATVKF
jgi:tetratricopeptide (TPR) repeat protein